MSGYPPCARPDCGHTAWPHGDQSGHPAAGDPCHAAVKGPDGFMDAECPCEGYERPQSAPAAVGSGTVYPPDGGSSLHGAAGGPESASGSERPTAESPAERLRLAAETLERAAVAATPGPWLPEYGMGSRIQAVFVECDGEDCTHDRFGRADDTCAIGSFDEDGDNWWAILVNPATAPHLAAILRAEADRIHTVYGPLAATVGADLLPAARLADRILGAQR